MASRLGQLSIGTKIVKIKSKAKKYNSFVRVLHDLQAKLAELK